MDPVVKIGTDGKRQGSFTFTNLGSVRPAVVLDFSIGSAGELYALATTKDNDYLARFRSDATFDSVTEIPQQSGFRLSRFTVFPSGPILMTGVNQKTSQPETVIVDRADNTPHPIETNERFDLDPAGHISKSDFASAMLSAMVPADDGNVYVMRTSKRPTVIVFSPAGHITNRFTVEPPEGDYKPVTLSVSHGMAMVVFEEAKQPVGDTIARLIFRVVNASSGEIQADYSPPSEVWGGFACYVGPSQFSLLMPQDDNHFALITLAP